MKTPFPSPGVSGHCAAAVRPLASAALPRMSVPVGPLLGPPFTFAPDATGVLGGLGPEIAQATKTVGKIIGPRCGFGWAHAGALFLNIYYQRGI